MMKGRERFLGMEVHHELKSRTVHKRSDNWNVQHELDNLPTAWADCSLSHDLNAPALGAASWPLAEKRHSEMQHSPPLPNPEILPLESLGDGPFNGIAERTKTLELAGAAREFALVGSARHEVALLEDLVICAVNVGTEAVKNKSCLPQGSPQVGCTDAEQFSSFMKICPWLCGSEPVKIFAAVDRGIAHRSSKRRSRGRQCKLQGRDSAPITLLASGQR
jgi:hypothetical protein